MKQTVRSFALGLLTAGILLVGIYYFSDQPAHMQQDLSVDDMVEEMKKQGYRVMTEEEYITLSVTKDQQNQTNKDAKKQQIASADEKTTDSTEKKESSKTNEQKTDKKDNQKKSTKKKDKKDDVKTYKLVIESGMPSSKVGEMLEKNKIIDDAQKFNEFLEDKDYSQRVQLGEFKIKSDMTYEEIAKAITK
ncbi:MAG TPA: hypothetical protein VIG73_15370 [Cerasibacillus sp.]|uniref:hypothetical protein n=1 Tax=Cerasibacillus sp. TaxID=2498711 RepID=UPI002F404E9D